MINTLYEYLSSMFTKGSTVFAVWFAIFAELFSKYIFDDWKFVGFLFVLVMLDTFFGTWKVIKYDGWRALSLTQGERFIVKVFLYFGVLVLSHVLTSFTIHDKPNFLFTWIDVVLYGYMVAKEALSVARNINAIDPAYVPPFILKRLNKFMGTGNPADLTKDDPNESI